MRKPIAIVAFLAALLIGCCGGALASPSAAGNGQVLSGLPLVSPPSLSFVPPGYTTSGSQAMRIAESSPKMQAIHAREHPLRVIPYTWTDKNPAWYVDFVYQNRLVAQVIVSPTGHLGTVWTGPLAEAVWARGHFAPLFASLWVVIPFSVLFLVPFLDLRRPWRRAHLDALAVLSFLVSFYLLEHAKLEAAVWAVYPPLVYLAARMLWLGSRRARNRGLSTLLSERALTIGLLAIMAARLVLSLTNYEVVDVGYASVIGAHRALAGQPLYYAAAAHGDTYGPIAYLAYVPFEALLPWHGAWNYLISAHLASVVFDVVTVVGLVLLGRRLRPAGEGRRIGLALGWAWAACPLTLLALIQHTNDGLIAMLSVLALLVFNSPGARGMMLGLAAAAKFTPAALLPLFAGRRESSLKANATCVAGFALVAAAAVGLYLPAGGLHEFYEHTIGFQLTRTDVFSPWALHPGLSPLKDALEVAAVLLALGVALGRRERSLAQVSALAAVVTIAVQLPAIHWFYYYVVWFMPFLLVAVLTPSVGRRVAAPEPPPVRTLTDEPRAPEPILVGA